MGHQWLAGRPKPHPQLSDQSAFDPLPLAQPTLSVWNVTLCSQPYIVLRRLDNLHPLAE